MSSLFSIIGIPLGYILYFCYQIVSNYGLALILFTLITRLILLPLSVKQQKSMVKMAIFRPKMEEIQKKYGKNQQKLTEEMQKLYQKEGYSPMAGCLPSLIQFPILFGLIDVIYRPLYHVLRLSDEVINEALAIASQVLGRNIDGMTGQLSVVQAVHQSPDQFMVLGQDVVDKLSSLDMSFFGINLGATPAITALNLLWLIPILTGVINILYAIIMNRLNSQTVGDGAGTGATRMVMYTMPIISLIFTFQVPAGVGLYWAVSTLIMLIQQLILNKIYNPQEQIAKAKAEAEARREKERQEKREAKKRLKEGDPEALAKAMKQKEIDRARLAEARRQDAIKYGEEYIEVTDDDLK